MNNKNIVIDIETTKNYSIIGLYYPDENRFEQIPYNKTSALSTLLLLSKHNNVIGFNLCEFDIPHMMIVANSEINPHDVSYMLIEGKRDMKPLVRGKNFTYTINNYLYVQSAVPKNIIDVRAMARIHSRTENGNADLHKSSLKYFTAVYLNRIINEFTDFDANLTESEQLELHAYNREDLLATWEIYKKVEHIVLSQRAIGTTFNLNATCSTNSRLITPLVKSITGNTEIPTVNRLSGKLYDPRFESIPELVEFLQLYDAIEENRVNKSTISLQLFDNFLLTIGLGGLHGISKKIHYPNRIPSDKILVDFDIVSQYPSLYTQLDGIFHPTISSNLKRILDERKRMKAEGGCSATIAAYKLLLNGIYGKTNSASKTNRFFNPIGMYRVATSGQLQILYTIIKMNDLGYDVVYVNTDGFTILINRSDEDQIPHIKSVVTMLVNRFFSDIEIETAIYETGVFFNVNSYALIEKGTGTLKTKKDFAYLLSKSTPNVIPKLLLKQLLGIEQSIDLQDYIFIKTSKHGFQTGNKIAILYFCKNRTETIIMNRYAQHILSIDSLTQSDIDHESYQKRAEEICELSSFPELNQNDLDVLRSHDYYVPCKKNGDPYVSFPHHVYFDNVEMHNRYVVFNRPNKKCYYTILRHSEE